LKESREVVAMQTREIAGEQELNERLRKQIADD